MPESGRRIKGARSALRAENVLMAESLRDARHRAYAEVLQEACAAAGIDLAAVDAEARRRIRTSTGPTRPGPRPLERHAPQLTEARDGLRSWLDDYLANSREVYARFTGNPMLFLTTPESVEIIDDVQEPGMSGGSGRHVPHRAYSTYACTYDLAGGANRSNVLHPYLLIDNRDDQHRWTKGTLSIVLHFTCEAPIADWFLGERIWAPLLGYGTETYFPGWPSCSDRLPILSSHGCVWDSIRYDVRVTQDRNHWADYDLTDPGDPGLDYVRIRQGCYPGGTAEEGWLPTQEPISFPAINGFVYDAPGVLLQGVEQGGGQVRVDVTLTLTGMTYYKGEYLSLDFRTPNWLSIPWVAIAGRHVHL